MRIAVAGLGHVGAATLRILKAHSDLLRVRAGQSLQVIAVSARDKTKKRECDLTGIEWVDDPRDLALRDDIDIVIEVIGGPRGVAHEVAKETIGHGKHLITANKALMATYGVSLAALAEKAGTQLSFEPAVCGGIPVMKMLREGLAANKLSSLRGVVNGTCNYILTRMLSEQLDFDTALAQAQQKGYAERDPSADIDGMDSAYKLALLSALAFGTVPDVTSVFVEGIRTLKRSDLEDAAKKGGRIKLIAISDFDGKRVVQRVQPVFVPLSEPLAQVDGAANGIELVGDSLGPLFIHGQGAGGDATASAVVADLIDVARGHRSAAFGIISSELKEL